MIDSFLVSMVLVLIPLLDILSLNGYKELSLKYLGDNKAPKITLRKELIENQNQVTKIVNNFDFPARQHHIVNCSGEILLGTYYIKLCNVIKNSNSKSLDFQGYPIGTFFAYDAFVDKVCPDGYKIPSKKDIFQLISQFGDNNRLFKALRLPFGGIKDLKSHKVIGKNRIGGIWLANNFYLSYNINGNVEFKEGLKYIALPVRCFKKIENDDIEALTKNVIIYSDNSSYRYLYSDIVDCANFSSKHLNFLRKFEISEVSCETDDWIRRMKYIKSKTNTKLLKYDWMAAIPYYKEEKYNNKFTKIVYKNWKEYTLNDNLTTVYYNMGDDTLIDLYLDYGNSRLRKVKAKWWINKELGGVFDGIFFDWAGDGWWKISDPNVPPKFKLLMNRYITRHPNLSYNEALLLYLRELRKLKPDIILVTNQGIFADPLAEEVDIDMVESAISSDEWALEDKKGYCSLADVKYIGKALICDTWYRDINEVLADLGEINLKIKKRYPHLKEVILNYGFPSYQMQLGKINLVKNRELIYYNYSVARLFDHIYSMTDFPVIYEVIDIDRKHYIDQLPFVYDEIYNVDLGKIRGNNYIHLRDKNVYLRFYDKGFVLIYVGDKEQILSIRISDPQVKGVLDFFNKKFLTKNSNGYVRIYLQPSRSFVKGHILPIGRVYLYRN